MRSSLSPFYHWKVTLVYNTLRRQYGNSRKPHRRFTRFEQKTYMHLPLKARALNFRLNATCRCG